MALPSARAFKALGRWANLLARALRLRLDQLAGGIADRAFLKLQPL
jgi:hypothetical protein